MIKIDIADLLPQLADLGIDYDTCNKLFDTLLDKNIIVESSKFLKINSDRLRKRSANLR